MYFFLLKFQMTNREHISVKMGRIKVNSQSAEKRENGNFFQRNRPAEHGGVVGGTIENNSSILNT